VLWYHIEQNVIGEIITHVRVIRNAHKICTCKFKCTRSLKELKFRRDDNIKINIKQYVN
jgi:hypothetical protein